MIIKKLHDITNVNVKMFKCCKFIQNKKMNNEQLQYDRIIISGGGNRSSVYTGVLKILGKKRLRNIKCFCGVSGGALLAMLLSLGVGVSEILKQDAKTPFDFCWSWLLTFPITCFNNLGFVDIDHLRQLFINWVKNLRPGCENWTFQDLYEKRGIILEIPALSTKYSKRIVFNKNNTPNFLLIEAVVASSAIPIVFSPYYYGDDILTDGGLLIAAPFNSIDHYPFIDYRKEYAKIPSKKLCINCNHPNCKHSNTTTTDENTFRTLALVIDYKQDTTPLNKISSWWNLLSRFLETPLNALANYEFETSCHSKCHCINNTYNNNHRQNENQQNHNNSRHDKKLIKILIDTKEFGSIFTNIFPTYKQKYDLYKIGQQEAIKQNI